MGYRDYKLVLSKSQQVTASADSTYFLDTEQTVPGWEKGMPAAIIINVEAVTTAATGYTFEVVHKTSEPTHADAILCTAVALAANLTKGSQIVIPLPQGIPMLRYVRLYYMETGGTEDYTFSAYFTPMPAPTF
jgi:hypothetical protein